MQYLVKNTSNTFDNDLQPSGFRAIMAIANRFFVCECPEIPNGELVVSFPEECQKDFVYFQYNDGIKLPFDPFNGEVEITSLAKDHRGRQVYRYNEQQISRKMAVTKWIMINVWLLDKANMENLSQNQIDNMMQEINSIDNLGDLRTYIRDNLCYNL